MSVSHPLDNPVWAALDSTHSHFARVHGSARAYVEPVSPFMGTQRLDAQGWADLARLDDSARLIRNEITDIPNGAKVVFRAGLRQMVAPVVDVFETRHTTRPLTIADVPAMLDLTDRTIPGPFRERTIDLGGYIGIFAPCDDHSHDNREVLMAMAGRRMQTPDYCEISAVCTDPTFLRQGAAAQLTRMVAAEIQSEGKTAFLHVSDENPKGGLLYESLGFTVRARLEVAAVVFRDDSSHS